jgi:hypothetical protein
MLSTNRQVAVDAESGEVLSPANPARNNRQKLPELPSLPKLRVALMNRSHRSYETYRTYETKIIFRQSTTAASEKDSRAFDF